MQQVLIQGQLLVEQEVFQLFQQYHPQVVEAVQLKDLVVLLVDQAEVVVMVVEPLEQEILLQLVQLKVFLVELVDLPPLTILMVEVVEP